MGVYNPTSFQINIEKDVIPLRTVFAWDDIFFYLLRMKFVKSTDDRWSPLRTVSAEYIGAAILSSLQRMQNSPSFRGNEVTVGIRFSCGTKCHAMLCIARLRIATSLTLLAMTWFFGCHV